MHVGPAYRVVSSFSELHSEWSKRLQEIEKAIPFLGGTHNAQDLLERVMSGDFTFWVGPKCWALAAIETYPRLTRVNLFLAGGDLTDTDRLMPMIDAWGKSKRATKMICSARPAIDRYHERNPHEMRNKAWTRIGAVYEKGI